VRRCAGPAPSALSLRAHMLRAYQDANTVKRPPCMPCTGKDCRTRILTAMLVMLVEVTACRGQTGRATGHIDLTGMGRTCNCLSILSVAEFISASGLEPSIARTGVLHAPPVLPQTRCADRAGTSEAERARQRTRDRGGAPIKADVRVSLAIDHLSSVCAHSLVPAARVCICARALPATRRGTTFHPSRRAVLC
jgi:hypothetical protein